MFGREQLPVEVKHRFSVPEVSTILSQNCGNSFASRICCKLEKVGTEGLMYKNLRVTQVIRLCFNAKKTCSNSSVHVKVTFSCKSSYNGDEMVAAFGT